MSKMSLRMKSAIRYHAVNEIYKYLQEGEDPNAFDEEGNTLVLWAYQQKDMDIFAKIAEKIRNYPKMTYRMRNAMRDSIISEIYQYLGEGENPNAADIEGETIIHWACREGYIDLVEYLIKNGADIDLPDSSSYCTPLLIAITSYNYEIAEVLLEAGASPNCKDFDDNTPMSKAAFRNRQDIIEMLKEHGAPPMPSRKETMDKALKIREEYKEQKKKRGLDTQ